MRAPCVGVLAALLLGGCGTPRALTLDTVNDKESNTRRRVSAIEQTPQMIERGDAGSQEVREQLKRVAWRRSDSSEVRLAALTVLAANRDDDADTRNLFRLLLPTEPYGDSLDLICGTIGERAWTECAPALVRRWSKREPLVDDSARPERAALAALFPQRPMEDVVLEGFFTLVDSDIPNSRERLSAWTLLRRIDADGRTVSLLSGSETVGTTLPTGGEGAALLADLRAGASSLRAVPDTAEELDWLRRLREPANSEWWSRAASALATLNSEQARGLALRHAAPVLWAHEHEPELLSLDSAALRSLIAQSLRGRTQHQPGGDGDAAGTREGLEQHADRMAWGDLLHAAVAVRVVLDPAIAPALFEQAERDMNDRTTEHGGVIEARGGASAGGGFAAVGYSPRPSERFADNRFVAPIEMMQAGATALFDYHFHAQRWSNAGYAGPSVGDHEFTDRFGRACLVFTTIRRGVLAADYYQPGGVVIDLGEINLNP